MSSFINKFKTKLSERRRSKEIKRESAPAQPGSASQGEPTFSIQPHPAKTNDPADLTRGQPVDGMPGGGLNSGMQQYPEVAPYAAKGPYEPSQAIQAAMPQPAVRARTSMSV